MALFFFFFECLCPFFSSIWVWCGILSKACDIRNIHLHLLLHLSERESREMSLSFHFWSLSLSFFILLPQLPSSSIFDETGFLTPRNSRTIVSPNSVFELGFFKLTSNNNWYLGIWYKAISKKDYVWVANRDKPLSNSNNKNPAKFLWQSFDYPTDTLLAEMKLGWDARTGLNRQLTSWKTQDDPSSGNYTYKIEVRQYMPQRLIMRNGDTVIHRSDSSNRVGSNGLRADQQSRRVFFNLTVTREETTYSFVVTERNYLSKLKLEYSGTLQRLSLPPTTQEWLSIWKVPADFCDDYARCGSNSFCDMSLSPHCYCIKSFAPKNQFAWDLRDTKRGCQRNTTLSCKRDGFVLMKKVKLPDTKTATLESWISLKECRQRCHRACNCTGYAMRHSGSASDCLIWTGELFDIRIFSVDGEDLYVRSSLRDLEKKRSISRNVKGLIAGIVVIIVFGLILILLWKVKQKRARATATGRNADLQMNRLPNRREIEDFELPQMEFEIIKKATNNFSDSHILGEGGFGIVYKGRLLDGTEIAVKRLSQMSTQGTTQFINEATLISKLQHINLVRLHGCCIDGEERILIYEYQENLGLNSYLFGYIQRCKLNWHIRLEIINGVARGLHYLHQDSHFRIIHRDLKASNILLDKDMIPKISDFGMARLIKREDDENNTRTIVGTFGYMAPEYMRDWLFSVKSDVFSFGVLLLEIISGKRNRKFINSKGDTSLLSCVWRNLEEGSFLEVVDPSMEEFSSSPSNFHIEQVVKCLKISLLCVQEVAEDRPTMKSVLVMLGSEGPISHPKPPGYSDYHFIGKSSFETGSSSTEQPAYETSRATTVTISEIEPR